MLAQWKRTDANGDSYVLFRHPRGGVIPLPRTGRNVQVLQKIISEIKSQEDTCWMQADYLNSVLGAEEQMAAEYILKFLFPMNVVNENAELSAGHEISHCRVKKIP